MSGEREAALTRNMTTKKTKAILIKLSNMCFAIKRSRQRVKYEYPKERNRKRLKPESGTLRESFGYFLFVFFVVF